MLFLIRHGETALNATRVVQPADTPLSERGRVQAALLSQRLCGLGVTRVLCSDLPRARMTAEPIVAATRATLELSELLQERNFGDIRGTPYAELAEDFMAPGYHPPNGESAEVFDARVARAFAWIVEQLRDVPGNVAVVTHGLVLRSLCRQVLCVEPAEPAVAFANASLSEVDVQPPYRVQRLNCIAHLASLSTTPHAGQV